METKHNSKGKRFFAPTIAAGLMLAMVLTLTGCEGGKSALVGRWGLAEGPIKDMELLSDGTGIADGQGITWKVEKDRFYMTDSRSQEAMSSGYKISGPTLMLTGGNGKVIKLSKKEKCGDKWHYLATQSCKENEIANDRCNGKAYNLKTEYCSGDDTVKKYGIIAYGSVTHGEQAYKTVKIGTQTWMAENLNYNTEGSKCYENEPANCEKYGRLYNWETAKEVCPSGWHLPSNEEWDKLYRFADGTSGTESPYKSKTAGKYLKSKEGWNDDYGKSGNGLDVFGFSALPGGDRTRSTRPLKKGEDYVGGFRNAGS
ncbi:MAG: hypothetical protein LBH25_04440 [Fibromonadaceae bacterium]|jgi:uncharacterized protein (TIGR02145 family)|nr:hypothetical protein [Fibromonadaceae bacterium]